MACAACDRKRSTSPASYLVSRPGVAGRHLQDAEHTVAPDQRRTENRPFLPRGRCAVVAEVQPFREEADRPAVPFVPALAAPVEAADAPRIERVFDVVAQGQPLADPRALGLGPGDLLGGDFHGVAGAVANEQRR